MVKPGLGLFTARRKSQGNAFDEVDVATSPDKAPAAKDDAGGFRLLSRTEVERAATERRKTQEKSSKFPRFSGFGSAGNKARNQPFEDESPGSSKRDSKSSSGTQFSAGRPYTNGQHGSTSTLPSSTDTSSDDNLFSNVHRPVAAQHNSSPSPYSAGSIRKQVPTLPSLPKSGSGFSYKDQMQGSNSRARALTASSYASTATPPKLENNFESESSFDDDMFSHINPKTIPEVPREPAGRSLLSDKRTFHADPIKILSQVHVEEPLKSWDSRGSTDNLMSSSRSDNDSPPPPPPQHRYSAYTPVASESPTFQPSNTYHDIDAQIGRKSYMEKNNYHESSPEPTAISISSSSAHSYDTPYSSRSATVSSITANTTPKASSAPRPTYPDDDDDELFSSSTKVVPKPAASPARTVTAPVIRQQPPTPASATASGARIMTQSEFREYQTRKSSQPPADESSDEDDYEDEEDAIRKREEDEILRRKNQQMHLAREAMRRSTTAPGNPTHSESLADSMGLGMGFPSEVSMKADEWEDDDVPLGILAQHGFPSQARNRMPTQPMNAMPSYLPERPASAGALGGHASQSLPAFARNLPTDPYSMYVGGGLVRPMNRESMGFNGTMRGPGSVAGDSIAGGGVPSQMMYQDAGMSQPSLVDQIQMRDMTKPKYMGGASNKRIPGGPFTGMLGQQMNISGQPQTGTRMSSMPMMNPMMGVQGGQMGMGMGMGMNPMGYPMGQQSDYAMQMQQFQQMQQMIAMQQFQLQQMAMQQNPQQQDPRMSMAMPNGGFQGNMMPNSGFQGNMMPNGGFLSVPGMQNSMPNQQNRAMSFMSNMGNQQQNQQRPVSNFMGPSAGYTPSIAPSERSNVGLSARYRPVANNSDSISNGTSMTLQAAAGATAPKPSTIKGILKKGSPQIMVRETEDADEDWSKMAARKNRMGANGKENQLEDLTRGLEI